MNWIKENKFLAGYLAVVAVAAGVLGFLLFSAKGHYGEVSDAYTQQATELHRLQTLPLFPNAENLKKLDEAKKAEKERIDELQKNLAAAKLPIESVTPERFQDSLRQAVADFDKKAAESGMTVPKTFYFGFDRYQSIPPKPEAAPLLNRELKVMQTILDLLPGRVVELKDVKPDPLPEEGGTAKPEPTKNGPPAANRGGRNEKPLVGKHAFEVSFVANKGASQLILNSIVGNSSQFLIPRLVILKNEKDKGPSKDAGNAAGGIPAIQVTSVPAAPAAPGVAPAAPAADDSHTIIVGNEHVESTIRIEIVDVADLPEGKPGK